MVWAAAAFLLTAGCRMVGTEVHYGVSSNEMGFGEFNLVFEDVEGSPVQAVPFLVAGQGRLPQSYDSEAFQRLSLGHKARLPVRLAGGRAVVYVEAGGMVSYYEADTIGTPFEPELVGGGGVMIDLGDGWALDLGARARQPMGNGHRHDGPEHVPHDTAPEFVIGVRRDF